MEQSTELRGTAYHEAGHVVALREQGIFPAYVEVTSEDSGATDCSGADFDSMTDKAVFVIALAGIYAESKVRVDRTVEEFIAIYLGGESDRDLVDEVFEKRWMAVGPNSHRVAHNSAETFVERNWEEIKKIAKALLAQCESGLPARMNHDEIEQAISG